MITAVRLGSSSVRPEGIAAFDHPVVHPILGLETFHQRHPGIFQPLVPRPGRGANGDVPFRQLAVDLCQIPTKRTDNAHAGNRYVFHSASPLLAIINVPPPLEFHMFTPAS
jgi:hypothetical protein